MNGIYKGEKNALRRIWSRSRIVIIRCVTCFPINSSFPKLIDSHMLLVHICLDTFYVGTYVYYYINNLISSSSKLRAFPNIPYVVMST